MPKALQNLLKVIRRGKTPEHQLDEIEQRVIRIEQATTSLASDLAEIKNILRGVHP